MRFAVTIRLPQVIDNLLSNALECTKEGTISLSVEDNDGRQVIVSIKDSSQGIDPSILPKLFTKFATQYSNKGTELGLFIAKSIVQAHGGKIWAENNKEGKGATFSLSLSLPRTTKTTYDMKQRYRISFGFGGMQTEIDSFLSPMST